jgi:ATP-binding cassette subfamily B protein
VQLFTGSISENLRFGNENASLDQMAWACELANIKDFIAKQPQQYETQLTQGGNNLSGGQRQRIALARVLLKESPLLILDDCLNGIDAQTEARIIQSIQKLKCTKIIISQRIQMVMQCDQILVLEKGEVSGLGTHEELLGNNAIYQEIYKSQKE